MRCVDLYLGLNVSRAVLGYNLHISLQVTTIEFVGDKSKLKPLLVHKMPSTVHRIRSSHHNKLIAIRRIQN